MGPPSKPPALFSKILPSTFSPNELFADILLIEQRGLANAMFTSGPLLGPVVGPIIGGFIAERAGWRWVYWVLLMACGVFSLGFLIMGKETNASVMIRNKTRQLRKETGREDLQSAYDINKSPAELKTRAVLTRGVIRPFRMMFSSPIFPLLALYLSFLFSLLYLIFTTITGLFIDVYNWNTELTGLAYVGVGLGFMIGMVAVAKTSDKTVLRLTKANDGVYEPEMRLATSLFYAFFIPISFFWYGWSAEQHVHCKSKELRNAFYFSWRRSSNPKLCRDRSNHRTYTFRFWYHGSVRCDPNILYRRVRTICSLSYG
jgi:MFS family permease